MKYVLLASMAMAVVVGCAGEKQSSQIGGETHAAVDTRMAAAGGRGDQRESDASSRLGDTGGAPPDVSSKDGTRDATGPAPDSIPRYAIFEQSFTQQQSYGNPYVEVTTATATFVEPGGRQRTIPLFWDGAAKWKVRFSPDVIGTWSWSVSASDAGLNGAHGTFECVASSSHGGITTMAGFPYHFQHQDGTPYWLFGDTQWELFADDPAQHLTHATMLHYFDVRASQGFNYVHGQMFGWDRAWNRGPDGHLHPAFHDFNAEMLDPAYFRESDSRIAYANSKGLTVGIVIAEGVGDVSPIQNFGWDTFPNDVARLRYARYVVGRYSAYNVTFILATEWISSGVGRGGAGRDLARSAAMFDAIGTEVSKSDPHHRMIAIHDGNNADTNSQWFYGHPYGTWMTFGDYRQWYGSTPAESEASASDRKSLHDGVLFPRSMHVNKPVMDGEYGYWLRDNDRDGVADKPNGHTWPEFRRAAWVLSMGGGYFVTGFEKTYYGGEPWRGVKFDPDDERNVEVVSDLQNLKKFFEARMWWKLTPADSLVTARYGYCLADIGQTYVVYVEESTTVSLDLGGGPAGTYHVSVFDPRKGTSQNLPDHIGPGPVSLTAPDTQDWIFVITKSAQ